MLVDVLHAHRIRVALDDFGAGAPWFSYLKSFSVDYMKIDDQFTRDLLHKPDLLARLAADGPAVDAVADGTHAAAISSGTTAPLLGQLA